MCVCVDVCASVRSSPVSGRGTPFRLKGFRYTGSKFWTIKNLRYPRILADWLADVCVCALCALVFCSSSSVRQLQLTQFLAGLTRATRTSTTRRKLRSHATRGPRRTLREYPAIRGSERTAENSEILPKWLDWENCLLRRYFPSSNSVQNPVKNQFSAPKRLRKHLSRLFSTYT